MLTPMNVAPSGLPMCRIVSNCASFWPSVSDVFSRNSCVMAMPIDAKPSDVRSQARKVRSIETGFDGSS